MERIIFNPEEAIEVNEKGNIFQFDYLGFEKSVKNLGTLISKSKLPLCVAIYGDWGSGKTSFMKLLNAYLTKEFGFKSFWFDAWKYENDLNLTLPFLSEISSKLGDDSEIKKSVRKIGYVASLSLSDILLKFATMGQGSIKDIKKHFEYYEKEVAPFYENWHSETEKSKEEFEKIVDALREKKNLVIFLDDLDRCLPDNVIKLIESMKHFFLVKNCIFVIGADKKTLSKGIAVKYGTGLIKGEDYLEKIINISFNMPESNEINQVQGFMRQIAKRMSTEEWYKTIEVDVDRLNEILKSSNVKQIPRKFKRILQRFIIFLALVGQTQEEILKKAVCVYLIMKEFYPSVYAEKELQNNIDYRPIWPGTGSPMNIKEIGDLYGTSFADEYVQFQRKSPFLDGWLATVHDAKKNDVRNIFKQISSLYNL
ncbi:MAG: P-loop NTPase fold protein [Syntrophales bacterium]